MPDTPDLAEAIRPRSPQEHYAAADGMLREIGRMEDGDHEVHRMSDSDQLETVRLMIAVAQVHATLATIR